MEKLQRVLVKEIIDSEFAVSLDRADVLFDFLKSVLDNNNNNIELSFDGIIVLLTVFANEAIGKLYANYTSEQIESIKIVDADDSILDTIYRVKQKSAEFYKK